MSTIDNTIPTIKPMDKSSLGLKNKILNSHFLSNNENAKIPPAAEINIQSKFGLSPCSSSNLNINTNNKYDNISKNELTLNNNYKIKNSEFQVINEINSNINNNSSNINLINEKDKMMNSEIQSLKLTKNLKIEESINENPSIMKCNSINNNINDEKVVNFKNSDYNNNSNNNGNDNANNDKADKSNNNISIIKNHYKLNLIKDIQKNYSLNNNDNILNYEKKFISDESNKKNDNFHSKNLVKNKKSFISSINEKNISIPNESSIQQSELINKNHISSSNNTCFTDNKKDSTKIFVNKIKYKNNKLNIISSMNMQNKNKNNETISTSTIKSSSSILNSKNHINKKIHRSNREEDGLSTSKEESSDRYRDLTPNLPIQDSEGESDFDFSESLITSRKRKRCKSIFDIYFDLRKRNLKHINSSIHHDHKYHKENSLSQNSNSVISKENESQLQLKDKEKSKY